MRFAKTILALAACSLATAPVMASSASSATKLSLSGAASTRAASESDKANELGGGFIIPAVAIVAIITGVVIAADDDNEPTSP
jgi:hypothetical protein